MLRKLAGHRLVKDTLVLLGVQISAYVLPIITLPYLTRVLGPSNFGLTALGTAFVLNFAVITDYGFAVIGTREIAVAQQDPFLVAQKYSAVMSCKAALLALCLLVMVLVLLFWPEFRVHWVLYALSFLQVIGLAISPNWLFQGLQRMRFIAWSDYGAKVLSVALIFAWVHHSSDYLLAAAIQSGAFLISGGIGLYIVFFSLRIRVVRPRFADIRSAMIAGWPVFLSVASMTVVSSTNTLILGSVSSAAEVGFLSAAQRLIIASRALVNPVSTAIYPHMSRLAANTPEAGIRFLRKQVLIAAVPFGLISLGMLLLGPMASKILYGPKYAETGVLLRLMSMTPVVHAVSTCFGTFYMLAYGFETQWSRIITAAMVVNFICMFGLMAFLPPARAIALTVTLTDIFTATCCILFYRRTSGSLKAPVLQATEALR